MIVAEGGRRTARRLQPLLDRVLSDPERAGPDWVSGLKIPSGSDGFQVRRAATSPSSLHGNIPRQEKQSSASSCYGSRDGLKLLFSFF